MIRTTILWATLAGFFCAVASSGFVKTQDGDTFYIETSAKFTWYEALSDCVRLKMTLVAIYSPEKSQKLANLGYVDSVRVWIGGHDLTNGRQFQWISNSHIFDYTNWNKGEPNNRNEHCVEMFYPSMLWNDAPCDHRRGFICEEIPAVTEKDREIKLLKESYEYQIRQSAKQNSDKKEHANKDDALPTHVSEDLKKEIRHLKFSINDKLSQILKMSAKQRNCGAYENDDVPLTTIPTFADKFDETQITTDEIYEFFEETQATTDATDETYDTHEDTTPTVNHQPLLKVQQLPFWYHRYYNNIPYQSEQDTTEKSNIDETTATAYDETPLPYWYTHYNKYFPHQHTFETTETWEDTTMTPEISGTSKQLSTFDTKQLTMALQETNEKLNLLFEKLREIQEMKLKEQPSKIFYNFY
ncbi:uncharacterized protein isoform X2 [Musca autumnalis]|uniref:uncharacterized protein isoform X2 n=1 Tax=Musca autumnalis TaxID=221902 RepID=UPI003CF94F51